MNDTSAINCEQALKQLVEFLDGELTAADVAQMDKHLNTCRSCYSRAEFERRLKERLAELGREKVPVEFVARVDDLMRGFGTLKK